MLADDNKSTINYPACEALMFFICLYLQDNERVLESLQDCDYDVDATIAYVLQTMETMQCK